MQIKPIIGQIINQYRKELAVFFIAVSCVVIFWLVFPPDIHGRIRAIRLIQPESYHPKSDIREYLSWRNNAYLDEMFSSDKTDGNSQPKPPAPLDDLPEKFNAERYFDQLNRLRMAEGYALDYAYHVDIGGGYPLLYARHRENRKLIDHYDFEEVFGSSTDTTVAINAYMNQIRTDGSREGFIQLTVLRLIGEQFYLYWHAHYKDTMVLSRIPAWVSFSSDQVAVSLFVFTKWGGVELYTMKVKRNYPHSFISESSIRILPYSCGIRF